MNWQRTGQAAIESKNGRFRIAKSRVGLRDFYTVFERVDGEWVRRGRHNSADEAKGYADIYASQLEDIER